MELFSEIYSCYYTVVSKILNNSLNKSLSQKDINQIIEHNGFKESALYILPKLINGEWNLLNSIGNRYTSKNKVNVKLPLTALEKAWLKALLVDKRIGLFLDKKQISYLKEYLKDSTPLFNMEDFYYYDTFKKGDDYESEEYINNFRKIVSALKSKRPLTLSMESGKGKRISGNYIPCKIEYSSKDDKFRVYVARIKYNKVVNYAIINIGRILKIEDCKESFSGEIYYHEYVENNKCKEPVIIEISKERNAVERCMLHFANYEKRTEYDEITDKYISYIYYDKKDEMELLIRILSFGPVIKVLGPPDFLELVKERVKKQNHFLK